MIDLLGAPGELIGKTFEVVTGKDARHATITVVGDNALSDYPYRHVTLMGRGQDAFFISPDGACANCRGEHINLLEDLS